MQFLPEALDCSKTWRSSRAHVDCNWWRTWSFWRNQSRGCNKKLNSYNHCLSSWDMGRVRYDWRWILGPYSQSNQKIFSSYSPEKRFDRSAFSRKRHRVKKQTIIPSEILVFKRTILQQSGWVQWIIARVEILCKRYYIWPSLRGYCFLYSQEG